MTNAEMSESGIKVTWTHVEGKDLTLWMCSRPGSKDLNHSVNRGTRSSCFGDFSSLTTLCRDCITCIVHRKMTSWRKKLPRISIVARLRKEPSGSLIVLNHWLCGFCNSCVWIKKSLHGTSEPAGNCLKLIIDPMDWRRDVPSARALGRVVTVILEFYIVDYIMRECKWELNA